MSTTISIKSLWFLTLSPTENRIKFGLFGIHCAPCIIAKHCSMAGVEVEWIEFRFVFAPANPPFSPKTQKMVCGDCSPTEGRLLLCLRPGDAPCSVPV